MADAEHKFTRFKTFDEFIEEERNERWFGECPRCKEKAKWLFFYMGMKGERLVSGWVCLDCLNEMRSGKNNGKSKEKSKTGL